MGSLMIEPGQNPLFHPRSAPDNDTLTPPGNPKPGPYPCCYHRPYLCLFPYLPPHHLHSGGPGLGTALHHYSGVAWQGVQLNAGVQQVPWAYMA